jgi:hypothetical protein
MTSALRVVGVMGSTYVQLEQEIAKALHGVQPEQVVSISYSTSRILGLWLQHHALIVTSPA